MATVFRLSDLDVSDAHLEDPTDWNEEGDCLITLDEALKIMTDEYCAKIMLGTSERPKSALEISYVLGIPIAACYRRIRLLKKVGVLKSMDRVLTRKGKKVDLYLSVLKNSNIQFERGRFRIRFKLKTGDVREFVECPSLNNFE